MASTSKPADAESLDAGEDLDVPWDDLSEDELRELAERMRNPGRLIAGAKVLAEIEARIRARR